MRGSKSVWLLPLSKPNPRETEMTITLTKKEQDILSAALSYLGSNVDDANEALETNIQEADVFKLYGKIESAL